MLDEKFSIFQALVAARGIAQAHRTNVLLAGIFGDVEGLKSEMCLSPLSVCYEADNPADDPTLRMTHLCLRCHRDYVGDPITTRAELEAAKETYAAGHCRPCTRWRADQERIVQ